MSAPSKNPHLNRNHPLSSLSRRQSSQYVYPQPPAPQSVPMTPLDFSYSQSMLPANLLQTPSPYVGSSMFPPPPQYAHNSYYSSQASSPSHHGAPQFGYPPAQGHGFPFPPVPRGASSTSLDHSSVSRTVVLENLAPSLTLRAVLDAVDHGPIESCELAANDMAKSCYISFINTQTSVNFVHKHSGSRSRARSLQKALDSADLKISFTDVVPSRAKARARAPADYIKAKTLTYILEHNATRAVSLTFKILDSDLVFLMPKAVRRRCAKFGEVEDVTSTTHEDSGEMSFVVHFTAIDSAIKVFDYHKKRLPNGTVKDDMVDESVQLLCLSVDFHADRCDRSSLKSQDVADLNTPSSRSSPLSASIPTSPVTSRDKSTTSNRGRSESVGNVSSSRRSSPLNSKLKALNLGPERNVVASEGASPLLHNQALNDERFACDPEIDESSEVQSAIGDSRSVSPSQRFEFNQYSQHFTPTFHPSASDSFCYLPSAPYSVAATPHSGNSFIGIPSYPQYNVDQVNSCNRTLYLGNLHPKTTVEEICNNVRAGGLVESIKYYKTKRTCFITFVDPAIALKFYLNHQVMHQLIIRDTEVQVKWGSNHSGPLRRDIAYAVASGASRNVYIGLKVNKSKGDAVRIPDEATLREDFSKFGKMEQINFVKDKDCGFMNFMNISNAIKVVECFEQRDVEFTKHIVGDNGEFYEKYSKFKISYGKDRCGNPLRFSFKKRSQSYTPREKSFPETSDSIGPSEIEPIDEESANVFGITTSVEATEESKATPKLPVAESTFIKDSVLENEDVESDSDGDYFYDTENAVGDEEPGFAEKETKNTLQDSVNAFNIGIPAEGVPESKDAFVGEREEVDEEEDDEDDISIIIEADTTKSSQAPRKPRRKPQKVYHSSLDLNELLGPWGHPDQSFGAGYPPPHTPMPMQHMYYTPAMPVSAENVSGWYGAGPHPYNYGGPSGAYHNSGSQVMADYLAKSQDGYFYGGGYSDSTENLQYRGNSKRRSKE